MKDTQTENHSQDTTQQTFSLSLEQIIQRIPHRYPMLLVDRLEKVRLGSEAVGIKGVTINEPFFQGHFPDLPVMPGVLIIEAMAQTAAVLVMESMNITCRDHVVYFMSIQDARFRKPVKPGDRLEMHVVKSHQRGMVWQFSGKSSVDDQIVAQAIFTAQISKRPSEKSLV